jgi:transposase-like protein
MKNGMTRQGKQHYKCRSCSRQLVENPPWQAKSVESQAITDRLLSKKMPFTGIACVIQLFKACLQCYVNAIYKATPWQAKVTIEP